MTIYRIDVYLYVRIDVWKKNDKKTKKHPQQGNDASTVSAVTCRVGRGDQGEARPAISAPRGEPHLDLRRSRLKTWSKSEFSIAEMTWPKYLDSIHLDRHTLPCGPVPRFPDGRKD